MQKISFFLLLLFILSACKSKQKAVTKRQKQHSTKIISTSDRNVISKIINNAENYDGVRYKYGGTTKKGMDCSGLVYTAFKEEAISLPRNTKGMSITGDWIDIKNIKKGDLLFFATKKNNRTVNHVGLVVSSRVGNVEFIHSTTSKGVITSNLAERYWYFAFVQARRVL